MCAHLPPPEAPRRGAPPSPHPPSPQSPGSHTLNSSHWALAWDAGAAGCIERRIFFFGAAKAPPPAPCATRALEWGALPADDTHHAFFANRVGHAKKATPENYYLAKVVY